MLYGKFINALADRVKDDNVSSESRSLLGSKINEIYKEVGNSHTWEDLKRTGELVTVGNYTVGTITITNGSRTITGSGTAWTSSFVGRYLRPSSSTNWYRIITFVSSTQLTLESPILESSSSGIAYTIWARFYFLNSDVRRLLDFGFWVSNGVLTDRSNQFLMDTGNDISLIGVPLDVSFYGVNPFERTYNSGSVTLTQDSTTMTGTATSWLGNVFPGDLVMVSGQEYRVKRVESDTSIILLQYSIQTLSLVSYSITADIPRGVQFYPNSDKPYLVPYTYFKKVYNIVNESYDRPELPESFDQVILDGAEAARYREKNDSRWQNKFQEYSTRLKDLKIRFAHPSSPRFRQFAPLIPTRSNY